MSDEPDYGIADIVDLEETEAPTYPYEPRDPRDYEPGIAVIGTGSSHTVRQIPVTAVYQIPDGSLTCFPIG